MCGIGGIRRFGEEEIQKFQIVNLLLSNERRGNDATGVALQNEDSPEIFIWKSAHPASSAIQKKDFEEFLEAHLSPKTQIAIVHTRAATSSDYRELENDHPLFRDDCAVVHNGVIGNDEMIFKNLETKRNCETDSDVLRGILDEYGLNEEGMKQIGRVNGSVAMAAISQERPGWLMLVKSGSPLHIGLTSSQLVFASEKEFVYDAVRPYVQRFGMIARPLRTEVAFSPMPNDSGFLIGPKGLEIRREVKTSSYQRSEPDRSRYNLEFHSRRKRGKSKAIEIYRGDFRLLNREERCGHCGRMVPVPGELRVKKLSELVCKNCFWQMDGKKYIGVEHTKVN